MQSESRHSPIKINVKTRQFVTCLAQIGAANALRRIIDDLYNRVWKCSLTILNESKRKA